MENRNIKTMRTLLPLTLTSLFLAANLSSQTLAQAPAPAPPRVMRPPSDLVFLGQAPKLEQPPALGQPLPAGQPPQPGLATVWPTNPAGEFQNSAPTLTNKPSLYTNRMPAFTNYPPMDTNRAPAKTNRALAFPH